MTSLQLDEIFSDEGIRALLAAADGNDPVALAQLELALTSALSKDGIAIAEAQSAVTSLLGSRVGVPGFDVGAKDAVDAVFAAHPEHVDDIALALREAGADEATTRAFDDLLQDNPYEIDWLTAAVAEAESPAIMLRTLLDSADPVNDARKALDLRPASEPLTALDHAAIDDYTGNGYRDINSALRHDTDDPTVQARVDATVKAVEKLSPFEGTVFRGTDLPADVAKRLDVGSTFSDDAFASASTKRDQAFMGNFQFTIQSRTGRDTAGLGVNPQEAEVLNIHSSRLCCWRPKYLDFGKPEIPRRFHDPQMAALRQATVQRYGGRVL